MDVRAPYGCHDDFIPDELPPCWRSQAWNEVWGGKDRRAAWESRGEGFWSGVGARKSVSRGHHDVLEEETRQRPH